MSKKILLVDDEATIRWIIKTAFEYDGLGHEILEAEDGAIGVTVATESKPDLIVMDYKMPNMNGWESTTEIRKFLPDAIIIGHTAYANQKNLDDGLAAGCTEIVKKPVDLEDWQALVKKYLG
jgi:CheY-like chemotaxis protein